MNIVTFHDDLIPDDELAERIKRYIEKDPRFDGGFYNLDINLLVNPTGSENDQIEDQYGRQQIPSITEYTTYILIYVYNILYNNTTARRFKNSPYDMGLDIKIDFIEQKFQLHLYVDDTIFGLIVGSKFISVRNLIPSILPIQKKIGFKHDLRFHPFSRYNTETLD